MSSRQIRINQLIAPFGPGAIYTDKNGTPLVVAGLDHWFMKSDTEDGLVSCDQPEAFDVTEMRLSSLLGVERLKHPPDYRPVVQGANPPPNAALFIPALRFPRWYRNTKTGKLKRFNLHTLKVDSPPDGGRWQPVRFISVCSAGHLCEFPWKEWIDCSCPGDGDLELKDLGGSDLSSIIVSCRSCPNGSTGRIGKTLSGTTFAGDQDEGEPTAFERVGITCPGDRPWLGEGAKEPGCQKPLVGALINQTNLYFARTISAIGLPYLDDSSQGVMEICNLIEGLEGGLAVAKSIWRAGQQQAAVEWTVDQLRTRGEEASRNDVRLALERILDNSSTSPRSDAIEPSDPEAELLRMRRQEFEIIRNEIDDPDRVPHLRVVATTVPNSLEKWINRINLVERLRETRAFCGFDRLEPVANPTENMPESAMQQLFRFPPSKASERWLPAVRVFGEGIFIELNEDTILEWQQQNSSTLRQRLDDRFLSRLGGVGKTLPPLNGASVDWASRYLLVHTLAHVLMNQFVFEAGYSTAALRERLFVSADPAAPMAALMIYTASGDAEGTLGGLVGLGQPDRFGVIATNAVLRTSWCSADPICSEHLGGQGSLLVNLAACHACVLLPETSCETINQGLDRAMVVGTPDNRSLGLMSSILEDLH